MMLAKNKHLGFLLQNKIQIRIWPSNLYWLFELYYICLNKQLGSKQKKGCVRETKRERRKRWEITSMHQVNESSQNTGLNQWQHAWLCMFSQSKEGTVMLGMMWQFWTITHREGLFDHSKRKWKWVVSEEYSEFPLKFSHQLRHAGAQQMKLKYWLK